VVLKKTTSFFFIDDLLGNVLPSFGKCYDFRCAECSFSPTVLYPSLAPPPIKPNPLSTNLKNFVITSFASSASWQRTLQSIWTVSCLLNRDISGNVSCRGRQATWTCLESNLKNRNRQISLPLLQLFVQFIDDLESRKELPISILLIGYPSGRAPGMMAALKLICTNNMFLFLFNLCC
jgi:hypothetical protein